MACAETHFTGTPLLLRAARRLGIELFRDMRERGLAAVLVAERDVGALIKGAKAQRRAKDKGADNTERIRR